MGNYKKLLNCKRGDIMGLLNIKIPVRISRRNRKYYIDKGYDIPKNFEGEFMIWTYDINHKSKTKLPFQCDNCKEIFERSAEAHYKRSAKGNYSTVYCQKCYHLHTFETIEERYGVKYYTQTSEYNEKIKAISLKKYGVEHYRQSQEVEAKRKQTCLEKYGVDNFTKTEKMKKYSREIFAKNGLVNFSKAQKHICDLVNGQLNYLFHGYYLDILYEDWLDIEYDGSGHDLRVKHGDMTQEEFGKKEKIRYAAIHSYGIKTLVIKGNTRDILPDDGLLLQTLNESIEHLRNSDDKTFTIDYSNLVITQK